MVRLCFTTKTLFLKLLFFVRLNFLVAVCIKSKKRKKPASSIYHYKNSEIQIEKKKDNCKNPLIYYGKIKITVVAE